MDLYMPATKSTLQLQQMVTVIDQQVEDALSLIDDLPPDCPDLHAATKWLVELLESRGQYHDVLRERAG